MWPLGIPPLLAIFTVEISLKNNSMTRLSAGAARRSCDVVSPGDHAQSQSCDREKYDRIDNYVVFETLCE
jgi:hypothetical protein